MFDRATCDPVQGVLAQGMLRRYNVTCAYFHHWPLFLSLVSSNTDDAQKYTQMT